MSTPREDLIEQLNDAWYTMYGRNIGNPGMGPIADFILALPYCARTQNGTPTLNTEELRYQGQRPLCQAEGNTCMNLAELKDKKRSGASRYSRLCDSHRRRGHKAVAVDKDSRRYVPLNACEMCLKVQATDRHRIIQGGVYDKRNVIGLCRPCHDNIHRFYNRLKVDNFSLASLPPKELEKEIDEILEGFENDRRWDSLGEAANPDARFLDHNEAKQQLLALYPTEQPQHFDYLLECFEAVARYAQNPRELGGMRPDTALHNYKNYLRHHQVDVEEIETSDLKHIVSLLPKIVEGRELSLVFDKTNRMWYVGHPTLDGDFSVGKYGWDEDIEGAALSLLSQFDEEAQLQQRKDKS